MTHVRTLAFASLALMAAASVTACKPAETNTDNSVTNSTTTTSVTNTTQPASTATTANTAAAASQSINYPFTLLEMLENDEIPQNPPDLPPPS